MRNRIIPVITISTNTDYKRNLIRDSFSILKFTNDYELDTIDCVEPNSDEETSLQENIKRKNELESMAARMSPKEAARMPRNSPKSSDESLSREPVTASVSRPAGLILNL